MTTHDSTTTKDPKPTLRFPKKFFWGASMAAHQVEGGNHNQWSIWELENAATRAQQAKYELTHVPVWDEIERMATNPANYISGKATDHYNRYEEDFDIAAGLHMNALRFSIEWSRIEPEEGKWDELAIEHYRLYLHALKRRHLEPFVTLWHWTMPEWFVAKGGFEKRRNVKYFTRFVQKVIDELGADFRFVIILNEPAVYATKSYLERDWPPMGESKLQTLWVYWNLVKAHRQAARRIKKTNRKFQVGIAENFAHNFAGDDAWLSRASAWVFTKGNDAFLWLIRGRLDFIGVNYYFTNRFYGTRVHNEDKMRSDLGWNMAPADIEFVLERLHRHYNLPLIVTENGLADRNDEHRKWWLTETITAMNRALKKGVRLEGYLHWSLLDNFEWAYGFWPRFGLVAVDYRSHKRTVRPSALWFGKIIKKLRSV